MRSWTSVNLNDLRPMLFILIGVLAITLSGVLVGCNSSGPGRTGDNVYVGYNNPCPVTIVVSASDSVDVDLADSTYQCDGTNDHVEIQAALDAANGGTVKLLSGTYNASSFNSSDSVLVGEGWDTIINMTGNITLESDGIPIGGSLGGSLGNIQNMRIDTAASYNGTAVRFNIKDVKVTDHSGLLENVFISGTDNTTASIGLLFDIEETTDTSEAGMAFCNIGPYNIDRFETQVKINVTSINGTAYFNSNTLEAQSLSHATYPMVANGVTSGTGSAEVSGNIFGPIILQSRAATTVIGIDLQNQASGNVFTSIYAMDWSLASGVALNLGSSTVTENYAGGHFTFSDSGNRNTLVITDRSESQHITIKAVGGDYDMLSSAFGFITDSSASKRYTIDVYNQIIDTGDIVAVDYIDVVGHNAEIIVESPTHNYGVRVAGGTNTTWSNLKVVLRGTSATSNNVLQIAGDTDETFVMRDCEFVNEITGANGQTGISIKDSSHPTFYNVSGIGQSLASSKGWSLDNEAYPYIYNGYGYGTNPFLIAGQSAPIIIGGDYVTGRIADSYSYVYGGASPIIDGATFRNERYATNITYASADNGRFRPFAGHPYQVVGIMVNVSGNHTGYTVDIGTSVNGTQIASGIDIGTTGDKYFDFTRGEVTANGYLYVTPSSSINDGDLNIRYSVIYNYSSSEGMLRIAWTEGYPQLSNINVIAGGASDALRIAGTSKNWRVSNSHLETLDPTNQKALNISSAMTGVPVVDCTLIGGLTNVTGFEKEMHGTATILSGNDAIVVDHGISTAPTGITVTGQHAEVSDLSIGTIGATQFTITASGNVTANRDIFWNAEIQ